MGVNLPDVADGESQDKLSPMLERLLSAFNDVQYFGTHRVVDYHAWIKGADGRIIRRFAYLGESGEVLANDGEQTEEERALDLTFGDERSPSEEDVMKVAGAWSIDPTQIDVAFPFKSLGLLGSLPKR